MRWCCLASVLVAIADPAVAREDCIGRLAFPEPEGFERIGGNGAFWNGIRLDVLAPEANENPMPSAETALRAEIAGIEPPSFTDTALVEEWTGPGGALVLRHHAGPFDEPGEGSLRALVEIGGRVTAARIDYDETLPAREAAGRLDTVLGSLVPRDEEVPDTGLCMPGVVAAVPMAPDEAAGVSFTHRDLDRTVLRLRYAAAEVGGGQALSAAEDRPDDVVLRRATVAGVEGETAMLVRPGSARDGGLVMLAFRGPIAPEGTERAPVLSLELTRPEGPATPLDAEALKRLWGDLLTGLRFLR